MSPDKAARVAHLGAYLDAHPEVLTRLDHQVDRAQPPAAPPLACHVDRAAPAAVDVCACTGPRSSGAEVCALVTAPAPAEVPPDGAP